MKKTVLLIGLIPPFVMASSPIPAPSIPAYLTKKEDIARKETPHASITSLEIIQSQEKAKNALRSSIKVEEQYRAIRDEIKAINVLLFHSSSHKMELNGEKEAIESDLTKATNILEITLRKELNLSKEFIMNILKSLIFSGEDYVSPKEMFFIKAEDIYPKIKGEIEKKIIKCQNPIGMAPGVSYLVTRKDGFGIPYPEKTRIMLPGTLMHGAMGHASVTLSNLAPRIDCNGHTAFGPVDQHGFGTLRAKPLFLDSRGIHNPKNSLLSSDLSRRFVESRPSISEELSALMKKKREKEKNSLEIKHPIPIFAANEDLDHHLTEKTTAPKTASWIAGASSLTPELEPILSPDSPIAAQEILPQVSDNASQLEDRTSKSAQTHIASPISSQKATSTDQHTLTKTEQTILEIDEKQSTEKNANEAADTLSVTNSFSSDSLSLTHTPSPNLVSPASSVSSSMSRESFSPNPSIRSSSSLVYSSASPSGLSLVTNLSPQSFVIAGNDSMLYSDFAKLPRVKYLSDYPKEAETLFPAGIEYFWRSVPLNALPEHTIAFAFFRALCMNEQNFLPAKVVTPSDIIATVPQIHPFHKMLFTAVCEIAKTSIGRKLLYNLIERKIVFSLDMIDINIPNFYSIAEQDGLFQITMSYKIMRGGSSQESFPDLREFVFNAFLECLHMSTISAEHIAKMQDSTNILEQLFARTDTTDAKLINIFRGYVDSRQLNKAHYNDWNVYMQFGIVEGSDKFLYFDELNGTTFFLQQKKAFPEKAHDIPTPKFYGGTRSMSKCPEVPANCWSLDCRIPERPSFFYYFPLYNKHLDQFLQSVR